MANTLTGTLGNYTSDCCVKCPDRSTQPVMGVVPGTIPVNQYVASTVPAPGGSSQAPGGPGVRRP